MKLDNRTPFALERTVVLDERGAEQLVVALKATWDIESAGGLRLAEEQDPIHPVEEFLGEPDGSSIVQEAELGPPKPASDVFLQAEARAARGEANRVEVGLRVGPLSRRAVVFGERVWAKKLGRARATEPEPFDRVPLTWENTFGGRDFDSEDPLEHEGEPRNPVGCGFVPSRAAKDWIGARLPQIEDPDDPIKKPGQVVAPVGFGPIGRSWKPRVDYAGTYDENWVRDRMPLLPEDFDVRFHNAAPPGLVAPGHLEGGEPVEVTGCTRSGRVAFRLPRVEARALVSVNGRDELIKLSCDTVTIDLNRRQLRLLWKGALGIHRELLKLREIRAEYEELDP